MARLFMLMLLLPALSTYSAPGQNQRTEKVVFFGDSLTAGYGAAQGQSFPDYLKADLASMGLHPQIVNAGVSGATTKDGLEQLPSVLAMHPSIVVLELGANDGLRGAPPQTITANLSSIIEGLLQAHARVVLVGIEMPPNYGPDYLKQFDGIYPALAHKYKLPLVPFILKDVYDKPALMSPDNIHPNGAGYRVVARTVLATLLPLLKK